MNTIAFDLETTGPDQQKDKIVQLCITEIEDEKTFKSKTVLLNPGIPISPAATEIHGITDDMVKNKPTFSQYAKALKKVFENKIIITYNGIHFDIPILCNEFDRAGIDIELSGKFIDVYRIEKSLHSQKLSEVYKRYTGKDLEDAHNAEADVIATCVVLNKQTSIHNLTQDQLLELSGVVGMVDFYGKLKKDEEGYLIYTNWGKNREKRVKDDPQYSEWIVNNQTFPKQVRKLVMEEHNKYNKKKVKL